MKLRSVLSVLLLSCASSLAAQTCPDLGTVVVPGRLVAGPSTICGIGLAITIGGVTYTSQQGFCPSFVLIMPQHAVPAQPRVGYYYVRANPKDVHKQDYKCYGWIWTACRMSGSSKVIYAVDNYVDVPCRGARSIGPPSPEDS